MEELLAPVDGEAENKDDKNDKVLEDKEDSKPEEVEGKGKTTEASQDIVLKPEEDLPQQPGLLLTTKRTKTTKVLHCCPHVCPAFLTTFMVVWYPGCI